MSVDPAEADSIPAFSNVAKAFVDSLAARGVKPLFQRMIANSINFNVNIFRIVVHWLRYNLLGQKGLYRVTGPGEIFVMARLAKRFKFSNKNN